MKKVTLRFEVLVPDDVSVMEITEWAEFKLGARGQLPAVNRLGNQDLEALRESVWIDA